MNFKIDTREKFTVITPVSDSLSDNLTAELIKLAQDYLQNKSNLVINFINVAFINERNIKQIAALHNDFYSKNISIVLCELNNDLKHLISDLELDDVMNITPTETEATDIVQMEEIEREILGDE